MKDEAKELTKRIIRAFPLMTENYIRQNYSEKKTEHLLLLDNNRLEIEIRKIHFSLMVELLVLILTKETGKSDFLEYLKSIEECQRQTAYDVRNRN